MRLNHKLPVWFTPIRSNFCQKFIRCNACAGGQSRLRQNLGANLFGDLAGIGQLLLVLRYVQIRFIQRNRLNQIGIALKNRVNLLRHLPIQIKMRWHKHRLRTQSLCRGNRHCRAQTKLPRFIRCRANHRARTVPRHHHRQSAQMWLLAQFYRCVECVHVDVYDFSG